MMLLSDFKTRLQSKIHGTNLNKVQDVNNLIFEAAGNLLLKIDPAETKRTQQIANALYDSVYDSAAPADLKRDKIIDIRPQANRSASDNESRTNNEQFDLYKESGKFTVENRNGIKVVRISKNLKAGVLLNDCESTTLNGTWTASADAENLAVDPLYFITGGASLKFGTSGSSTTATLSCTDFTDLDLSTHDEVSSLFVWLYIPTLITNATLDWGNDSSNYWRKTVTAAHFGSFQVGWNLLRFDWSGAAETGTVDPATIDYLRFSMVYDGVAVTTGYRIDSIYSRLPTIYEFLYYSAYLFRNTAGTWILKPTADTDEIVLEDGNANILLYETCFLISQELKGKDATFDVTYWKNRRDEAWRTYSEDQKSEAQKSQNAYYKGRQMRRR